MRWNHVCIEGFGHVLGDDVVTSAAIEERLAPVYERLSLPVGRLEMMTGVRERRFFAPGTKPSTVAAQAGERVLETSGVDRGRVGALFHCAVSRDFMEPATASVISARLGIDGHCHVMDLSNACLGVLNGMTLVATMIEAGQIEAGLLVTGEIARPLMESTVAAMLADTAMTRRDTKRWFASLTIGSGAVAVLLTHASISRTGKRLLGGSIRAHTQHVGLCQGGVDADGALLMNTDSEALLQHGVATARETWLDTAKVLGWSEDGREIDKIVGHQVGVRHRAALFEALGLDATKDFNTFDRLGNVGSAACPITYSLAVEAGHVRDGDTVAMFGIGSGINCLMLGVQW